MAHTEDKCAHKHQRVAAIDSKEEERDDGERGPSNRYAQDAPVVIPHRLLASEVAHPEDLVEHHAKKGNHKNAAPEIQSLEVEIREHERHGRDDKLPHPLEYKQDPALFFDVVLIILRLVLRPYEVGDEEHEQPDQSNVREPEAHSNILLTSE